MRLDRLKRARVVVSLVFFVLTTILFLDFVGVIPTSWANGIVYLQFVPSLLKFFTTFSITVLGFVVITLLTFAFGRVYCSTICPLGTFQDIVSASARRVKPKRHHKQIRSFQTLHYSLLAITVSTALSGSMLLLNLLDPFSTLGRIISNLFRPIVVGTNNALAFVLEHLGVYTVYPVEVKAMGLAALFVSFILFVAITWLAFNHGRLYCNTICPVGALLGLMSKFSLYKIAIDAESCIGCNLCEQVCKAGCIDKKAQVVDFTRCVGCYNCFTVCPTEGLVFEMTRSTVSPDVPQAEIGHAVANPRTDYARRDILLKSLLLLTGTTSVRKKNIVATKESTVRVNRAVPVTPPGARTIDNYVTACTACHLCISACPSQVLSPAFLEYGISGILQPRMNYHIGFCNFECTVCADVCPCGALLPLAVADKKLTQVGIAKFVEDNCIVKTEEKECGACSEHCPTKAVNMVPYKKIAIPEVKEDYCVGCGACEFACPTKPYKAIYVEGKPQHGVAKKAPVKKLEQSVPQDFPF